MRWRAAKSRTTYFQANPSHPMPSQQTSEGEPSPTTLQWIGVPSAPSAKPSAASWREAGIARTVASFDLLLRLRQKKIVQPMHHLHAHPDGDGQANPLAREGEARRLGMTLALALLAAVVEAAGGTLAHSLALVSDAGHMLADAGAIALSLFALRVAARPADARRTYGYYRLEILAALLNGAAL